MRVLFVCPAPRGSRIGNRRTAERWARLLRELGHTTRITTGIDAHARWDVLVALHARRSAHAVREAKARAPDKPVVVALTGTDLYVDIHHDDEAKRSLDLADALVVLQPLALRELAAKHRRKAYVILQSADAPPRRPRSNRRAFEVALVAHMRSEKDPLLAAAAARRLSASSRVRVLHAGRALDPAFASAARREQKDNSRYRWLGELSPAAAIRLIARARLLVLTSRSEGGANVIGEAVACGTPVLATRIPAAVALLGERYPALFRVGDASALARLIERTERDSTFRTRLSRACRARRALFRASRERGSWRRLLARLEC